jgi:hypothetical protein
MAFYRNCMSKFGLCRVGQTVMIPCGSLDPGLNDNARAAKTVVDFITGAHRG